MPNVTDWNTDIYFFCYTAGIYSKMYLVMLLDTHIYTRFNFSESPILNIKKLKCAYRHAHLIKFFCQQHANSPKYSPFASDNGLL